jgi:hypothetical protein
LGGSVQASTGNADAWRTRLRCRQSWSS